MTNTARTRLAIGLFCLAGVLLVVGLVLRSQAEQSAEDERVTAEFTNAILSEDGSIARVSTDIEPDYFASTVALATAGISVLAGVVVVALRPVAAATPSPGS